MKYLRVSEPEGVFDDAAICLAKRSLRPTAFALEALETGRTLMRVDSRDSGEASTRSRFIISRDYPVSVTALVICGTGQLSIQREESECCRIWRLPSGSKGFGQSLDPLPRSRGVNGVMASAMTPKSIG